MFKKNFYYIFLLISLILILTLILFGSILRHHYLGGSKFETLQRIAVFLSEIPTNTKKIYLGVNDIPKLIKHKDKDRFTRFLDKKRNALLVLPRYDHINERSVVDIIDLNNFQIIHTYKHNIQEMNNLIQNQDEFATQDIDRSPKRYQYYHPIILEDGSLISHSPLFKIDICSNLLWINDSDFFHHSIEKDHDNNLWVGGQIRPHSKKYIKGLNIDEYLDDSIVKFSSDGEIIFNKSVTEILIENKIGNVENFLDLNRDGKAGIFYDRDPIHLNDIQPALSKSLFWEKDDVFLSLRGRSAIIQYRPTTNKIINYITGPFSQQHDIDIISDKEISIFNNNNFFIDNEISEILIYDLETKKFKKLFNKQLQNENFKTLTQGLSHIFEDGSLLIEEQNHGRIILFNNEGEKEWEFVNKNEKGEIGFINWSRIIEDELFINTYKKLIDRKKCIN